jgi:hypothetical protein
MRISPYTHYYQNSYRPAIPGTCRFTPIFASTLSHKKKPKKSLPKTKQKSQWQPAIFLHLPHNSHHRPREEGARRRSWGFQGR